MYNTQSNTDSYAEQNPSTSYMHIASPSSTQPVTNQQHQIHSTATYYSQQTNTTQMFNPKQLSHEDYPPLPSHSQNEWHTITYNRKRNRNNEEHGENQHQNKKQVYWLDNPTTTNNRYEGLSEEEMETTADIAKKEPKPPPIFVSGVKNIKPLIQLLDELAKDNYTTKTLRHDQVKIQPLKSDVYSTILKALMEKNTEFHTYKPKKDKTFRVVLKNMHPTTDLKEISNSLAEKGHMVINIWNVKQRNTNVQLPLFFVDLKAQDNNKEIYKVKLLMNTCVQFEAPHIKREIPQCMRCQKYGHTRNYCHNNPRCVKCARNHLTKDCPRKTRDEEVICVNCKEHHPANYRGCIIHKQIQQKIYPTLRERKTDTDVTQPGISYAQIMKPKIVHPVQHEGQTKSTTPPQPANDLAELKQMMKNLMDQMGTLINLIATLVNKSSQ